MQKLAKPKIVYVLPNFNPDTGSHFFHIYELLEAAAKELDIFLVAEKAETYPLNLKLPFYCQKLGFGPLRFMELAFVLLRERFRGRKYFYTHYSFFGAVAAWLVVSLTGGKSFYWNCGMPWLYRRPFLEELVFRFAMRRNILVTGTPGMAREYIQRYGLKPAKVRVLPNWINTKRFYGTANNNIRGRLGIPPGKKIILFVHRLSHRKGADLIPEIAAEVTKRDKNVILVIVGAGPEEEKIKSRLRSSALDSYVRFAGEVPNRKIVEFFRAADVFFMPSDEEGFPRVLLEAQAAGRPYVASDVGGVREITPPELLRFIVPARDVKSFSDKIIEILSLDSLEHLRLAKTLQNWARQYDIIKVLPKFRELFS